MKSPLHRFYRSQYYFMSISSFLKRKFKHELFFPAHIRGKALPKEIADLLKEKPGSWDLPELPEIGTVLSNKGLISDAQKTFADKFSAKDCWFGVNGASGLIQSAILSMAKQGEYILIPRNVHISVIKVCLFSNIRPVFYDLEFSEENSQYLPLSQSQLKKILNHNSLSHIKISGIIIINPYYQGYATEIDPLVDICHQKGIPVLVDEAHGAYFLFCEDCGLPRSAVRSNADLVVQSLHKSLNGLTQTAILWFKSNLVEQKNIVKSISLLETTSPSALLLASCEESIKDWLDKDNLNIYKELIYSARNMYNELIAKGIPLIKTQDPLKIILNTGLFGIDGYTADKFFYKNGLIAELPEINTLTFCLGFAKQDAFVNTLENLWTKLIQNVKPSRRLKQYKPPFTLVQIPQVNPADAWRAESCQLPLSKSIGRICAELIYPYPPGIPLIIPGEKIDKKRIEWIIEQGLYYKDLVDSYLTVLEKEQ